MKKQREGAQAEGSSTSDCRVLAVTQLSAVFLASTSIYVMSPRRGGGRREGEGRVWEKENDCVLKAASFSTHAVTIQRMSGKPTCLTDSKTKLLPQRNTEQPMEKQAFAQNGTNAVLQPVVLFCRHRGSLVTSPQAKTGIIKPSLRKEDPHLPLFLCLASLLNGLGQTIRPGEGRDWKQNTQKNVLKQHSKSYLVWKGEANTKAGRYTFKAIS